MGIIHCCFSRAKYNDKTSRAEMLINYLKFSNKTHNKTYKKNNNDISPSGAEENGAESIDNIHDQTYSINATT